MILYFSGTGNSKHLARIIGEKTGESLIDIAELLDKGTTNIRLAPAERLGFVFPVHFWGLPVIVKDFIKTLHIGGYNGQYVFMATSYGMVCGNPYGQLSAFLDRKGIKVNAAFCVRMVDVWTPIFDLSDKGKTLRATQKAIPKMEETGKCVKEKLVTRQKKMPLSGLANLVHKLFYTDCRDTKAFHVTENCIGCGKCAKDCPTKAIALQEGKPHWVKSQCTMCLRCLHHCPAFAIQYGNFTQRHGQFSNPYV